MLISRFAWRQALGRPLPSPHRRWAAPRRPRPRAADASDAPVPSPAAERRAWLDARFAREAEDSARLSPLARIVVALAGGALAVALATAGVVRALTWPGG